VELEKIIYNRERISGEYFLITVEPEILVHFLISPRSLILCAGGDPER